MNQWREGMKARTHRFTVDVLRLRRGIPERTDTRRVKDQLVGDAVSVDLNWRATCRERSHKEFTAKLGTTLEEADEAEECLDVIHDAGISEGDEVRRLRSESKELRSIFAKASRTASDNERRKNS